MVLGGRTEVAARLEHVLDCWVHMLLVVITVDIEGEVEALPVKQWCWSFAFRLCAKCQYHTGTTKSARRKSDPREQSTSRGAELRRNRRGTGGAHLLDVKAHVCAVAIPVGLEYRVALGPVV